MTTMQAHFSASGHKQTFTYSKEIERAYKTFPDLLSNSFFVNVSAGRAMHVDPEAARTGNYIISTNRDLSQTIFRYNNAKASEHYWSRGYDFILLYQQRDLTSDLLGASAPLAQLQAFIFDHELAHALSREKNPGIKAESLADAYAILRHFQRFGIESKAGRELSSYRRRTADFDYTDGLDHYTSPVVDYIERNKKKLDIPQLSPRRTFELAAKLAECIPTEKELHANHGARMKACDVNRALKS